MKLEIVDQWSTRIPPHSRRGAVGNVWIAIEHGSKSRGFHLPIRMGNVLERFGFDVQSQAEVRVKNLKNQIGSHFESDIAENQ